MVILIKIQWRIQDFPEVGAPTLRGGAPTYDIVKFSQKLHEIERIWTLGDVPRAPLDPPLTYMSQITAFNLIFKFE